MELIIVISLIYISIILYIYVKYNMNPNSSVSYDLYRDELEILPAEAGYLLNKEINSMNLILADILTLVNSGYIEMELINVNSKEKDYRFTKIKNKDITLLKSHQVVAYNMFFSDRETLTLDEFLANIRYDKDYNREAEIKYFAIKVALDKEFENLKLVNTNARKKLSKINSLSLKLIFGFIIAIAFSSVYVLLEAANTNIIIAFCSMLLFSIVLYFSTNTDEVKLTPYGAILKSKASGFKNYLQKYVIIEDKPLYMVNILDYYYINAVSMELVDLVNKNFSRAYLYATFSHQIKS